jgi:hypothetical protein
MPIPLFVASLVALLVGSAVLFHFTLLGRSRFSLSEAQWEAVDYSWYVLAAGGFLLGSFQIQMATSRAAQAELLRKIESRYFDVERIASESSQKHCPRDPPQCELLNSVVYAIRETQFTSGWPIASIRYKGRVFDSLNLFVRARARELDAESIDGRIEVLSTIALDLTGRAREAERRITRLGQPPWVATALSYVLAVAVALRVTKVTFKVRLKSERPK